MNNLTEYKVRGPYTFPNILFLGEVHEHKDRNPA